MFCRIENNTYLCTAFEKCMNMVAVVQWLERQIVVLNVVGSIPTSHPPVRRNRQALQMKAWRFSFEKEKKEKEKKNVITVVR